MEIFKSERLVLRNLIHDDIDVIYDYRNDINCAKYQRWENTSKEYLENFIEEEKEKVIGENEGQFAIELKDSNELIGDIFIAFKDKTITLGYTINPKNQRKGYAYEILNKLIGYIFENFDGYEIVGMVHPDNSVSKKLLEKLKFENEGYVEKLDSIIYSLHKSI